MLESSLPCLVGIESEVRRKLLIKRQMKGGREGQECKVEAGPNQIRIKLSKGAVNQGKGR